jgi:hypothetical protein
MKRINNNELAETNGTTDTALVAPGKLEPWERALVGVAQDSVNAMGSGVSKLSVRGRTFKTGETVHGDFVDCVVTSFAPIRSFFPDPYNASAEPKPPICWANAALTASGLPDQDADHLQPHPGVPSRQAGACMDCVRNKWGSGNGGRGKACSERMQILLLIVGSEKLGAIQSTQATIPAILNISPTARPAFRKFLMGLQGLAPWFSVISRVSFDPKLDWPSPIWAPIGPVPSALKEAVHSLVDRGPRMVTESPWPLAAVQPEPETYGEDIPLN